MVELLEELNVCVLTFESSILLGTQRLARFLLSGGTVPYDAQGDIERIGRTGDRELTVDPSLRPILFVADAVEGPSTSSTRVAPLADTLPPSSDHVRATLHSNRHWRKSEKR